MSRAYTTIEVSVQEEVATITLRRPDKRNAMNRIMAREMLDALPGMSRVQAVVITGDIRAFSSGVDLSEPRPAASEGPSWLEVFDSVASLAMPAVAAIEGYCLGGGLELSLCCDLRVAGRTAQFGTPEVLRGLLPGGGGTQRLLRLIGPTRAKGMMFCGDFIDASTAERWGLVNRVVPTGDALAEAAGIARRLAGGAPLAIREIKRLVDAGADLALPTALELERARARWLAQTEDAREGVRAFLERRSPQFRGE